MNGLVWWNEEDLEALIEALKNLQEADALIAEWIPKVNLANDVQFWWLGLLTIAVAWCVWRSR